MPPRVTLRRRLPVAMLATAAALTTDITPARAGEPPIAAPAGEVRWKKEWDRFTPAEGAFTVGVTVGTWITDQKLPNPTHPVLDVEVPLFDDGVRGVFRGRTAQVQNLAEDWSNVGLRVMTLFPYVVDAGVVATGIHRNPDVGLQLFLIDLQSITLAATTQRIASRLTSHPRPYVQDCAAGGGITTSRVCGDLSDLRSFFSGHAAVAFTSAGLTCLHHQHIPLYGGGAPDAWACTWAVTVASITSFSRIVADAHWPSEVLLGVPLGWFYGYLLPKWLHYGSPGSRPKSILGDIRLGPNGRDRIVLAPSFTTAGDGGVLGVRAVF